MQGQTLLALLAVFLSTVPNVKRNSFMDMYSARIKKIRVAIKYSSQSSVRQRVANNISEEEMLNCSGYGI
jgi:hypothetical protein